MPPRTRPQPQDHLRKPATAKPASAVFDVDALQRDGTAEPFRFTLGGEDFTCADPDDMDWQVADALSADDVAGIMRATLGEQYAAFAKHPMPVWKLTALGKAVNEHYSLGEDGASRS